MTTSASRLILAATLASPTGLALAHGTDFAHTHAPDGLTMLLIAGGAFVCAMAVAGLLVWQQRRRTRSKA